MASHKDDFDLDDEDFEIDDWGFGDDLDGGDFLSDTPAKDDRNPVLRLGGKFVSGLGKTFVDPNVQRRMIKDNLPDGFGAAYDAGLTGITAINDIKRDVDRNLGSIIAESKQTLTRVSPTIEKQLPQALAKKLNAFTQKHGTKPYDTSNFDPDAQERGDGLAAFLEQVEAYKIKEESTKRNVMNKKDASNLRNNAVQQRLLDTGNRAQMHTNAILNRILGYHTEVTTNFQMKSLELQYNQFFMLRKGVDLAEQHLSLSRDSYDKIIKNTGLPDALKLRTLEHVHFLAKEGVINKLNGKFTDTVGSFVQKGVKQFGENLANKAEELKSAMSDLESMIGMLDMLNSMDDEPPGAREQVMRQLDVVFGMIGGIAGGKVEALARKYAEKKNLKGNSKLIKWSEKIKAFMGNGSQRLNSYLTGDSDTGVGFLDNTVRGLLGGAGWSQDTKLINNKFDNLGDSSIFDYRTKRTINDIIPGYLKLIHHELMMTRTGDDTISPLSFDWQRNKFDTDKSIGAKLTEKLTGSDSVIAKNASSINKFVNAIDPGKELSKETRKTLAGLVSENMANGGSIFDVYTMLNNFNPQGPNAVRQRDELNKFMQDRGFDIYADTSNEIERNKTIRKQSATADKFYNSFNKAMDQSRWDYESGNEEYQRLIDLGFGDQLAAAGLVVQDEDGGWSVNQDHINRKTQRRSYKGFATGGHTGPGNKYDIKGAVHADEFVVRSEVVKQPRVKGFLDQLNMVGSRVLDNIGGYASGGEVQPTSTNVGENKAGVTLESIIEAIRSINPLTQLKEMSQSLRGIEFRSMRELMGNVEELPQQLRTFYESNIKNAKPGASIKQTWDRFTQRAKQNKIWDIISKTGKEAKEAVQGTYQNIQERINPQFGNHKLQLAQAANTNYQADIFTEDDLENPKLSVDGFKNGEYFDELTGHPVKSVKDIRGTVVDKLGNVKLHAKDFAKKLISPSAYVNTFLKTTQLSWATQAKAFGMAKDFVSKHNLWGKAKQGLGYLKSSISNLNTDVYIEGREEPVLLLKDIKAGNLYNGERKQITSYNDISGDIFDTEGNLVLSESEYANAKLVGADGKPLKGFMRKQIRRIKAVSGLTWKGVKGFNKFRKKAWQAQFRLMFGAKDMVFGGKKKSKDDEERERYEQWMMGNANPEGLDEYANSWQRFKGKLSKAGTATRDYLTGETERRRNQEQNIGQLLDHDGNPIPQQKDAFDTMTDLFTRGKNKAISKLKEKYGAVSGGAQDLSEQARYQAWLAGNTINNPDRDTGQTLVDKANAKLKQGVSNVKESASDLAEKARLEAWYLKNTINNPDRETGETLSSKARAKLDGVMAKAKSSIPDWLATSTDDDEELKRYKATLRKYWIEEQKAKLSGFINKGKTQAKKIDWKAAEAKVRSLMPTADDVRYEAKLFEMHLSDKGITKENIGKNLRAAADKLNIKLKESIPEWMTEFTEDDEEVKRYKATLRKYWMDEQRAKVSGKTKALKGKAKISWTNAKKQLESMMPTDEQKLTIKAKANSFIDKSKTNITNTINAGKSKLKDATGKWGLDKDEKGIENKQYRDKGTTRLVRDIHRLLSERLPKPQKGIWNDRDGNGFREGSIEDQLADREKNAKQDPNTGMPIIKEEKKKPKGLLGIVMAIASGVGTLATMVGGFIAKAMSFGKFFKNWAAKQAAIKAATSALGGMGKGGCCCGCCDGDDYLDRDERRRKNRKGRGKGRGRGRGTGRGLPRGAAGRAGSRAGAGMMSRLGSKLTRGPGWLKVAGLAALGIGGYAAMSDGASAGEVAGDMVKESYRSVPGVGSAVDMYDMYNEYNDDESMDANEERGENPGFFKGMWNGTKDALGLNTSDGVADFARDTAVTTAGMAAATGAISGGLAGTGIAAGALAALGGPVTLGIILGGAAIYGGIKLYQALKKGDKPLMSFRMAQYGYKDSSKSEIKLILKLENELLKQTRVQGMSVAFNKADVAVATAIQSLGIDTQSPMQMKYFAQWFNGRFKPVFFAWVAATNNIKKGITLDKLDETFKPQEKLDLMASIHSEVKSLGAYSVTTSFSADKVLLNAEAVDKLYKANQNHVEAPQDRASKEKAEAVKQEEESKKSSFWESTKSMFSSAKDKVASVGSSVWDSIKNSAPGKVFSEAAKDTGNAISNMWDKVSDTVSNTVASMTGSQKEWQMKVYSAFKKAGFSEQQSRILTAEIGRENAYNPKYLFGGHADPHSGTNLGMLSWQGARTPKLVAFLREAGVLDKRGNMVPGQAALDAQAKFIMWEMNNTHKKAAAEFLSQPNIDYAKGAYIVGKRYILWRIDDPKYGPSGKKNRDGFYNMLLKQLGSGATVKTETPSTAKGTIPLPPKNTAGIPVTIARPGTNTPGFSLDPSKKPNIAGMAMPGAPKSGASGAGILADPKKIATVGNTLGPGDAKFANHKAVKAAKIATQAASGKSLGLCAKYVATALLGGGYKFTRQNSAYMYHTNGILSGCGFVPVNTTTYQIGDVAVWPAHGGPGGGGTHGHIQIFNGRNWVSDFIQRGFVPGKFYGNSKPTVYRDKELVGANVHIVADSNKTPSDMTMDNTAADGQGQGAATGTTPLSTKYANMSIGDIMKKRQEAKVKIYGADGSVKDYNPTSSTGSGTIKADKPTAKVNTNNPNNTTMKPTVLPGTTGFVAEKSGTTSLISSTSGGTAVDVKKDNLVQQEAAKQNSKSNSNENSGQTQAALRDARMSNNANAVGNTSANFPVESIRLFTSMDSRLAQVVTALNKLAVINQDGVKATIESGNRQAQAFGATAKAMGDVATAAINNGKGKEEDSGSSKNSVIKSGVIGAGKPQPVSVLS